MTYRELLELTKKYPNPFYLDQPSLKYREYLERSKHRQKDPEAPRKDNK